MCLDNKTLQADPCMKDRGGCMTITETCPCGSRVSCLDPAPAGRWAAMAICSARGYVTWLVMLVTRHSATHCPTDGVMLVLHLS